MKNSNLKTRARIKEKQKKILAPKRETVLKVFNLLKSRNKLIGLQKPNFEKIEKKKAFSKLKAKKNSIEKKKGLKFPNSLKKIKIPKSRRRKKWAQKKKINPKKRLRRFGLLRIKFAKRNIYLNLSDSRNRLRLTISTGYIKVKGTKVRGKARKAVYILKQFARRFTILVRASKINRVHLVISGYIPRKVKRIFLKTFKIILVKKFKIKRKRWPRKKTKEVLKEIKAYKKAQRRVKAKLFRFHKYTRHLRHPHNGCRPRKVRRR